DECAEVGMTHRLVHKAEPGKVAEICDGRMRPIQEPEFRCLERRHVRDEQRSASMPGRPTVTECILDDPLAEGLRLHIRFVAKVAGFRVQGDIRIGYRRHDAVHHRRGKTYGVSDPGLECTTTFPRECQYRRPETSAVCRKVVAGHYRRRRDRVFHAHLQCSRKVTDRTARPVLILEIVPYVRVI